MNWLVDKINEIVKSEFTLSEIGRWIDVIWDKILQHYKHNDLLKEERDAIKDNLDELVQDVEFDKLFS